MASRPDDTIGLIDAPLLPIFIPLTTALTNGDIIENVARQAPPSENDQIRMGLK